MLKTERQTVNVQSQPAARQEGGLVAASPQAAAQRELAGMIENSPRQAVQRKMIERIHNSPHQLAAAMVLQGRFASSSDVVQCVLKAVDGCPGLFYDDDTETYCDAEGNTYAGETDFRVRKGSGSTELKVTEEKKKKNKYPLVAGDFYRRRPPLEFNRIDRSDVRGVSASNRYHIVYRFADVNNPNSMYPYPGETTDALQMDRLSEASDQMLTSDMRGNYTGVKGGRAQEFFKQKAILTVAYGRDHSPFIPVGVDFHLLANHKNRLMQEIVRTPRYFEVDPLLGDDPAEGKRAPHILEFSIPLEKAFLVFDTRSHDPQAASAGEQEVFGPMKPFLSGWAVNPY